MATIELNTQLVESRIVIAYDASSGSSSNEGGNVEATSGDTIGWQCADVDQSFLVRFYRFDTGGNVWPFSQQPDKSSGGNNPVRYLRVNSKTVKNRTVTSTRNVKYVVEVESGPAALPLDPMIIIRSKNFLKDSVLFGVTCAVVGAFLGALLVTWWT